MATKYVYDAAELQGFLEEFEANQREMGDYKDHERDILKRMDEKGYHNGAFRLVRKLLNMDLAKAQDFMRAFEQYALGLGLEKRLESQSDLIEAAEEEEAAAAVG
jgi:uncharacterized protein (UPF0335 family)